VSPWICPALAVLRAVHVVRLLSEARGIRKLLHAFILSLPALFNIGLLLFIVTFTSSVFGMLSFGQVKRGRPLDDMLNFEMFGSSMACMLLVSSSAPWGGLLAPLVATPPHCDPDTENPGAAVSGDCGCPAVAIVFFVAHVAVTLLLVVHLYIAIVLETFQSEDAEPLSDAHAHKFDDTWKKFDPEASQFIPYRWVLLPTTGGSYILLQVGPTPYYRWVLLPTTGGSYFLPQVGPTSYHRWVLLPTTGGSYSLLQVGPTSYYRWVLLPTTGGSYSLLQVGPTSYYRWVLLPTILHYMSFSRRFYPKRLTISAFQPRVQSKNNENTGSNTSSTQSNHKSTTISAIPVPLKCKSVF